GAAILARAVRTEHAAADGHLARDLPPRPRPAREPTRPALAHLVLAGEPRPGRVHADDILVLGPHRHHAFEVAALERLVEGVLRVLRRREVASAHSVASSASTRSTVSSRMQRKCPSGHSRW